MDITQKDISLHSHLLDKLFAYKSKTRSIFGEILGLFEIHYFAIGYVNQKRELLVLSSTPSLDYNLFNRPLWRFDRTYSPSWFEQCGQASWQSLYAAERYDELYYIKQLKPRYPLGLSMAAKIDNQYMIYSLASRTDSEYTRELFATHQDDFYKIGQYCTLHLLPLLLERGEALPMILQPQVMSTL